MQTYNPHSRAVRHARPRHTGKQGRDASGLSPWPLCRTTGHCPSPSLQTPSIDLLTPSPSSQSSAWPCHPHTPQVVPVRPWVRNFSSPLSCGPSSRVLARGLLTRGVLSPPQAALLTPSTASRRTPSGPGTRSLTKAVIRSVLIRSSLSAGMD